MLLDFGLLRRSTSSIRGLVGSSACFALGSGFLLRSTSSIPGLVPPTSLQSCITCTSAILGGRMGVIKAGTPQTPQPYQYIPRTVRYARRVPCRDAPSYSDIHVPWT